MAGIGERRGAYRVMVPRPGRKRPLRRRRRGLEDNIQIDLKRSGMVRHGWIDLAQERYSWWALLNLLASLRVPQNVGNFFSN